MSCIRKSVLAMSRVLALVLEIELVRVPMLFS
jgi:hypothetical protein